MLSVVFFASTFVFTQKTHAAPQILAAFATHSPQPFTCEAGVCSVEITTFCLQKVRSNPVAGTQYFPHPDTQLMLVLDDQNVISANGLITLESRRGFSAVMAQFPEKTLKGLGANKAALAIGPGAMFLPVEDKDDPDPIIDSEISYALETLRPMADEWIDGTQEKAAAVKLVNSLINATPVSIQLSSAVRHGLWDRVWDRMSSVTNKEGPVLGSALAKEMFTACAWRVDVKRYPTLRSCLEVKHDSQLMDMNLSYWKATAAGS